MLDHTHPSLVHFPSIGDTSLGFISIAEHPNNLPFEVKRVYWTYYTPHEVVRGFHAHKALHQIIFAICGTIRFNMEDRHHRKHELVLSNPNIGLHIPPLVWREIQFSHNAVLLCLASEPYLESDYIRSYDEFLRQT